MDASPSRPTSPRRQKHRPHTSYTRIHDLWVEDNLRNAGKGKEIERRDVLPWGMVSVVRWVYYDYFHCNTIREDDVGDWTCWIGFDRYFSYVWRDLWIDSLAKATYSETQVFAKIASSDYSLYLGVVVANSGLWTHGIYSSVQENWIWGSGEQT